LKQNPSEGGSHQKLGFGSDGTDSDAGNGSPAAGAHRRRSGWRGGAFRCLRAEESREKLEFAARGRKLGRGSVGGLNRRENQRGRGASESGDGTLARRYSRLARAATGQAVSGVPAVLPAVT
jgi:hypothetical protein